MKGIYYCLILSFLIMICFQCTKETIDENGNGTVVVDSVFYDTDIKTIIEVNCIGCHSGTAPRGNLDLSTYSIVKFQTVSRDLIERINDSEYPMPVQGLMPADDRGAFDKWLKDGTPETK
jgi:hypothetical protein